MTTRYQDPDTVYHLNMKAVVRETGIKADTLRAWERRYGIPEPERSEGGHRLYSNRDIQTLLWLKARQEEGISIKLAVEEWRRLEEAGEPMPGIMRESTTGQTGPFRSNVDALRDEWVDACRAFDEERAEQVLSNAFAMFRPEEVGIDLLARGLAQIGMMWASGELTVQQEHFASEVAGRKVEALIAASPPPIRSGRVLILCPPGEDHAFIPLLITLLLRQSGRAVVFLGANVPVEKLEESVRSLKPVLVILSASLILTAASALDLLEVLRAEGVMRAFGGSLFTRFPHYIERIPAHFLGSDLSNVVSRIESLILHRPALPEQEHDQALLEERDQYAERLVDLEQHVWKAMDSSRQAYRATASLNRFMTDHILAALRLGDPGVSYSDRDHFLDFLGVNGFQETDLEHYLDVYIHALDYTLGPDSLITRAYQELRS